MARGPLLRHPAEVRQIGIVAVYWILLFSMFFVPACRNVLFFAGACYFSFLNAVVIHNHLHQGIFRSKRLNLVWRAILSFGALYPASANIASHNLVHHHFDDDGQPDWAAPEQVGFRWHFLNLLHFPNVAGPQTFNGVSRWIAVQDRPEFQRQYLIEQIFGFGLTGVFLLIDPLNALFYIVLPQLWGARGILRINLIQHDRCDVTTDWNHSRNFVGRGFNWIMCNNGYHTIHHNKAGLHWSDLARVHDAEVKPKIDPSLDERSMVVYLFRTFFLGWNRPQVRDVAAAERAVQSGLATREERRREAESKAHAETLAPV